MIPVARPRTYQDVVRRDQIAPPPDLLEHSPYPADECTIDPQVYLSPDFHRREMELLWPRVWQFACREEELPETGDLTVYELGHHSIILVRTEEGRIKGYHNSCRHRGRRLCTSATTVNELRCPYHGFAWSLNGELRRTPAAWDFPHLRKETMALLEVRTATWGGFVFINMDPDAEPLESYLEQLPEQLQINRYEHKYIRAQSRHVLQANWKTVMESFMEGLHAPETHGHSWPHLSDTLQYDVLPGARHVSRSLHVVGLPVQEGRSSIPDQEILNRFHHNVYLGNPPVPPATLPSGMSARQYLAGIVRMQETLRTGHDYTRVSDAEALDVLQYSLFPNTIFFRGISLPVVLRFRPNGDDHESCIFDLLYLDDVPKGKPRPPPAAVTEMTAERTYQSAGVLPDWLGYIYDQDMENIANMRAGLRAGRGERLLLSHSHESRIRHLHATLSTYLSARPPQPAAPGACRAR